MAIIKRVGAGLLVLTLLVAGCGDDDTDDQAAESSTEVDGTDDQGAESDPDYGTDQESGLSTDLADSCEPVAVHADWAAYISACQYEDGRVEVVNESAWVLVVNAPWASSVVIGPSDEDLSPLRASAVNTMLTSAPAPTSGGEYLPPGAAATALGAGGPVYLDFDRRVTPQTYAVDVLARWAEGRLGTALQPRGVRLAGSVANCATGFGNFWGQQVSPTGQSVPLAATFISFMQTGCPVLVQELFSLLDDAPPAPPTLVTELDGLVKSIRSSLLDDLATVVQRALTT